MIYISSGSASLMCLAGAVANVTDSDHCCNPKVPSSVPAGGKDFPWARKFNHLTLCRGGAHKSTGPLYIYSELKIRQVKDPTCSRGCSVAKFVMWTKIGVPVTPAARGGTRRSMIWKLESTHSPFTLGQTTTTTTTSASLIQITILYSILFAIIFIVVNTVYTCVHSLCTCTS